MSQAISYHRYYQHLPCSLSPHAFTHAAVPIALAVVIGVGVKLVVMLVLLPVDDPCVYNMRYQDSNI